MMPIPRPVKRPRDRLRIEEIRVHARLLVDEPGTQMAGGVCRVAAIAGQRPRGRQRRDVQAQTDERVPVRHEVVGVRHPVFLDVGTCRGWRVRPPVVAFREVVVQAASAPGAARGGDRHGRFGEVFVRGRAARAAARSPRDRAAPIFGASARVWRRSRAGMRGVLAREGSWLRAHGTGPNHWLRRSTKPPPARMAIVNSRPGADRRLPRLLLIVDQDHQVVVAGLFQPVRAARPRQHGRSGVTSKLLPSMVITPRPLRT